MQRTDSPRLKDFFHFLKSHQRANQRTPEYLNWPKIQVYTYGTKNGRPQTLNSNWFDNEVRYMPDPMFIDFDTIHKISLPDFKKYYIAMQDLPPTTAPPMFTNVRSNSTSHDWGSSALVWAVAIIIMGILVLAVRAAEKCLENKLFKMTRTQSEEWPTPSVIATSQQIANTENGGQPLSDAATFQTERNDLPPPYSECANVANTPNEDTNKFVEEPPPPYSACYVAYSAPKDGVPSVHFLNNRRQNIFEDASTSRSDSINDEMNVNRVAIDTDRVPDSVRNETNNRDEVVINMNHDTRERLA